MKILSLVALVVTAALLPAHYATASPNGFHVHAGPDQNFAVTGAVDQTSSSALSTSGTMTGLQGAIGTAPFAADAGPGIVRVALSGSFDTQIPFAFNPNSQAGATTDLLISGPPGQVPVDTSINLHIDGTFEVTSCGATSGCDISVFINGPSQRHTEISATFGPDPARNNFPELTIDTIPNGRHVHGDFAVPMTVMSNTPFTVTLTLELGGRGSGIGSYTGDFHDSGKTSQLSFASAGVLFNNLPAGYTVSGENVVDNHWTNPFAPSNDVVVSDCNDPRLASVTTVTGSLVIENLSLCTQILAPNLVSVQGDVIIRGNTAATVINLSSLTTVNGSIDVSDNTGVIDVNLGSITSVGGSIDIANNGDAPINLSTLDSVNGSINIDDASGSGVIDIGAGTVTGSIILDTSSGQATGSTALGSTEVAMTSGAATMDVAIPTGAFSQPVSFTITHLATDPPATGAAADGAAATIDPITSFQFVFAVPTLNLDASLTFTIDMSLLSSADAANILNTIGSGVASIIGKSDAPGATYTAFPVCLGAQNPAQNACAAVSLLDANRQPTTGQPRYVVFQGVVGHFSSYGVGIVTKIPVDTQPPVIVRNAGADSCSLPGDNGWCRGAQTAGFSASDASSAISAPCAANAGASCAFTRTAAANGASVLIASGVVCDALNNCNPGIGAGPFKIDSVVPMLAPSISPQSVQQGTLATASANASDATSGIASSSCGSVDTSTVGQHTLQCTARDNAGNTATASLTYTVVAQSPGDRPGRCGKDDGDDHEGHHERDDRGDRDHHGSMPGWWPRPGRFDLWSHADDRRFGGR